MRSVALAAGLLALAVSVPVSLSAQTAPRFTDDLLEMTPEVVARLRTALQAQAGARDAAGAAMVAQKTEAEYQQCIMALVQTEDYMAQLQKMSDSATDPQKAEKAAEAFQAWMEGRCGRNPADGPPDQYEFARAGREAGSFTDLQYSTLKERVVPLCRLPQPAMSAPSPGFDEVRYVYTQTEVDAVRPHCAELLRAMGPELTEDGWIGAP